MNAQEILEQAADIVDEHWCQNQFVDRDNNVCTYGALGRASGAGAGLPTGKNGGEAVLALTREIGTVNIAIWNDEPGRTRYEVSDAMRRAAKTLANEAPSLGMSHLATTREGKNPTTLRSVAVGGASETAAGA
jgi:hypothetical protein